MHLHINFAKLYLVLDDTEIQFKVPWLSMLSFILHIFTYLEVICLFGIYMRFSLLLGILIIIFIFLLILY